MASESDLKRLLSIGEPGEVDADSRLPALAALVAAMGQTPPDRDAPVREVMARLGDNWSALILQVLATGTYRHATLKRVIGALSSEGDISQRMLTLRLRALERDGLVVRTEHAVVPPRVCYALTPLGQTLTVVFDQLLDWIKTHEEEIEAARQQFGDEDA